MDSSAGKTDGGTRFAWAGCTMPRMVAEKGSLIYIESQGHTGASRGQGDPRSEAAANAPTSPSLRPCSPHNLK